MPFFYLCIQIDWSDYGVDWDEVASADVDNTVTLEDIEGILTDEQVEEFYRNNRVNGSDLSRQFLVRHFAAAKAFVYAHSH